MERINLLVYNVIIKGEKNAFSNVKQYIELQ